MRTSAVQDSWIANPAYNARMIGFIEGTVKAVIRDTVVVVAGGGGIGYRVHAPATVLAGTSEGKALSLFTHLAVRESAQELFGFETREELHWFELLLTVSGIGPRSALSIMNSADIATLENAIVQNDASVLTRAFGIGRKTAQKIVLELREKVGSKENERGASAPDGETIDALMALGYSAKEARGAARAVPKDIEGTENKIREALRIASGMK